MYRTVLYKCTVLYFTVLIYCNCNVLICTLFQFMCGLVHFQMKVLLRRLVSVARDTGGKLHYINPTTQIAYNTTCVFEPPTLHSSVCTTYRMFVCLSPVSSCFSRFFPEEVFTGAERPPQVRPEQISESGDQKRGALQKSQGFGGQIGRSGERDATANTVCWE